MENRKFVLIFEICMCSFKNKTSMVVYVRQCLFALLDQIGGVFWLGLSRRSRSAFYLSGPILYHLHVYCLHLLSCMGNHNGVAPELVTRGPQICKAVHLRLRQYWYRYWKYWHMGTLFWHWHISIGNSKRCWYVDTEIPAVGAVWLGPVSAK